MRSIIIIGLLHVLMASAFAQEGNLLDRKITLSEKNQTIDIILKKIETQSGVRFAYSSKSIDLNKRLTIEASAASIRNILQDIFLNQSINFKEVGGQVAIYKKKESLTIIKEKQRFDQTVRGVVRDIETNQPLIGVNVILYGSDPLVGASTNEFGEFKIKHVPLGRSTFKVTYLGYKSRSITNIAINSGKEVVLDIAMEESLQSLNQVIVKADIDKSKALNEMSLVSSKSFTVEETSLYAGSFNDPARMVSSYAGVSSGQDDAENQIIIRGNSPRGLLWRVEGIEVPNPNHFADDGASSGAISILNSNMLTNSDFMTGAFSAEYGNAFSGVFDIKLRNGNNEKKEYSLKAGFLGLDTSIEGPFRQKSGKNIPNASYLLSYRYSTVALINALGLGVDDQIRDPGFQDIAFKVHVPTSNAGVFSLWGMGGLSKAEDSQVVDLPNQQAIIRGEDIYNIGVTGLSHDYNLSDNAFLETKASYSSTKYEYYIENVIDQNVIVEDDERYKNDVLRVSTTFNKKINAHHTTKAGVIFSHLRYQLDSEGRFGDGLTLLYESDEKGSTNMWQGFVSHKYDISDRLTLTGGVHYLRLGLDGQQNVEPRFGLNWRFKDNQALSFGFGLHSRREETSLYFTKLVLPDSSLIQPNTQLDLAKAQHYVLGYDRNFGREFHLRIEAYYQYLYDIPVAAGPNNIHSSINEENAYIRTPLVNEGTGENYGVELTFEKFLTKGYYFLLTGAVYRSYYEVNGKKYDSQYNGKYNTGLVAGKEFSLNKNRVFTIGLEGILTGGKRIFPVDLEASIAEGTTVYDVNKPYQRRLQDYNRLDFQIAYKKHRKESTHEIKLDVQNLTGNENVYYEQYSRQQQAVVPLGYLGQLIPVLSYKVTF